MCDLDHFKQINDTLGHDRGDEVLVEVSKRFLRALRQHDVIARWGGEEFLMLLPDTDGEAARIVTERLRSCLCDERLELSDVLISVTASFGATTFESGCRLSEVLRIADEALYDAKAGGRNRVSLRPSSKPMKVSG
jgi:diguanylate cyclase (GGDEF)-like protein